jgi:hypothetical protein
LASRHNLVSCNYEGYIRDSGALHALLDLQYLEDLLGHTFEGAGTRLKSLLARSSR